MSYQEFIGAAFNTKEKKCERCGLNTGHFALKRCKACANAPDVATSWRPMIILPTRERCTMMLGDRVCGGEAYVTEIGTDGARTERNACRPCTIANKLPVRIGAST